MTNKLTVSLPVNPTANDINSIGLMHLLAKETIIHTVESETSSELLLHTHNRLAQGLLDVKMRLPLGDQSTNVTPSLFESMVSDSSGKTLSLSSITDPEVIFSETESGHIAEVELDTSEDGVIRNPLLEDVQSRTVEYSTFIIREECDVEAHHGQMLPYRFVQVVWAYEEGIPLEEQCAEFKDVKIYDPMDSEIGDFLSTNNELLDVYIKQQATDLEESMNQYLDSIALDFDYPNLETNVQKEELEMAGANFISVRDQLPNNPFFLHRPPRSMSEDELKVYSLCYNENVELYNPECSIEQGDYRLDKETMEFVKERMKARIGIYYPGDLPDDLEGEWGDDIVKVHRSIIFVPLQHFNKEFMSHLNDDVERRLEELDMFFDEVEKESKTK